MWWLRWLVVDVDVHVAVDVRRDFIEVVVGVVGWLCGVVVGVRWVGGDVVVEVVRVVVVVGGELQWSSGVYVDVAVVVVTGVGW